MGRFNSVLDLHLDLLPKTGLPDLEIAVAMVVMRDQKFGVKVSLEMG
jgi:hypothetical protein